MAALTVGELVAYAQLDKRDFQRGIRDISSDMRSLQSSTSSSMQSMESTVTKSLGEIERAIADGLDPASAIADLDRLERELDASFDEMLADADAFAAELEREIDAAFDSLDDDARESGRRAGRDLVDGLEDGLSDAERAARETGEDAGRGFGDGVEGSGGRGRMSGIGANLISGLKAGAIGLALAAGAAIGAKLIEGLESAMDAQKAKQKLFAQIGASEPEMKRLGKVAGDLYADAYGESMGDVTEAIKAVVQNIDGMNEASEKSLGAMGARAMDTAAILDEDVNAVTRTVAQILRNDLAPSAEAAFDLLVKGAQEGANKSEDLLDTFNEYSTQFREIGLTGKDALGLISQGLKAGARDADTVADALKEFAIRAKDGSDTSKEAFEKIGLNANTMFQVFAKGGEPAKAALGDVLDRIREIKDPVEQDAVAVGLFGTKAEDLQDALLALDPTTAADALGKVKGAAEDAGNTLNDTVSTRLTAFKRGLEQNITNTINDSVLPALDRWAAWFGSSSMGQDLEELRTQFGGLFDDVTAGVQEWVTNNQDTLNDLMATYEETFGSLTSLIGEWVQAAKEFWAEWGDTIMSVVSVALKTVVASIGGFLETVKGIFKTIKGLVTGDWQEAWDGVKSIAEGMTRGIRTLIDSALRELLKSMGLNWDQMKKDAEQKLDNLVAAVKALPSNLKNIASKAGTWLLQAGKDLIQGMINGVKQKAADLAAAAEQTVKGAVDGAKRLLGISSPSKVFEEIGSWTIKGLIQGLTKEEGQVKSTIEKMVDTVKAAFKSKPDVVDGLLDFVRVGNKNLEDLALQREALVQKLADAKELAKKVAGTAQEWADITGLKAEDFTGAGDLAEELRGKASAINNFANNIKTLAARGLNKKIIQDIIDAGVERGATFAEMLVGSDGSEIKALNKAQAAVDKASKKLGKASADAMFDVGKKSGEGYLKGLQESLAKLDKEMEKIVKALVAAIKKHLKIKSPSQVMMEIGQFTMQGFADGMQLMAAHVMATAQNVIGQAVAAAQKATGGGGGGNMVAGSLPGGGYHTIHESQIAPTVGVPYSGTPTTPATGGVTVNIEQATVREEADFGKLGAVFGFEYMAHA